MKHHKQRFWTKDELRQLNVLAKQRLPAKIVARRLKRSLDSTKRKASTLGVPLGSATRWIKQDVRKLRIFAKGKQPLAKISKKLKRTDFAIKRVASLHGISLDMRNER